MIAKVVASLNRLDDQDRKRQDVEQKGKFKKKVEKGMKKQEKERRTKDKSNDLIQN